MKLLHHLQEGRFSESPHLSKISPKVNNMYVIVLSCLYSWKRRLFSSATLINKPFSRENNVIFLPNFEVGIAKALNIIADYLTWRVTLMLSA